MSRSAEHLDLRVVAPRRSVREHISDIWRYRELCAGLIRKELHVRYQKSLLGFTWSLANPLFLLIIYSIVFKILQASFDDFSIWVMSGLLFWNFFATSVSTGTHAITGNGYLVGKVNFPREILPLAAVGAAFIHLLISGALLGVVLVALRHGVDWGYVWLVIPATVTCVVLASALAILLSAVNVYARDTGHLLELALLAGFWLTPIVYPFELVAEQLDQGDWPRYLHLANPITTIVTAVQRGVYGAASTGGGTIELLPPLSAWWYLRNLCVTLTFSLALLFFAIRVFDRAEANFAEVM